VDATTLANKLVDELKNKVYLVKNCELHVYRLKKLNQPTRDPKNSNVCFYFVYKIKPEKPQPWIRLVIAFGTGFNTGSTVLLNEVMMNL